MKSEIADDISVVLAFMEQLGQIVRLKQEEKEAAARVEQYLATYRDEKVI